ncbi:OPT family oligopeptide transporter [Buttiauxella sp. B2]|uniref:OPT/YSL family transporter n=1 Tax=Buttiauxella sp. B2 TaxID=2587812 RepID=UPI00111E02B8|nr:OPT/YSL family transporter [Buttiauxella sp. B2]TNV12499.1 OPT family oligopeptide transporter [Buttiauxella sp. B2]
MVSDVPASPVESYSEISVFKPALFILIVALSFLGAIIGMQIIVTLGISANTSIIGAVLAILLSRIPSSIFSTFRNIDAQNLVQTAISSATFAAANGLLISIGVPWVLGMHELIWPMLAGSSLALVIDGTILYGVFNSRAFPANGGWPAGVATAETLWAGNQGGKRLGLLVVGFVMGIGGACYGIPMASAGIALIGSVFALLMFAVGLLVRGYSESGLIHYNLYEHFVPHGFMIGAGLVALLQIGWIVVKKRRDADGKDIENNPELEFSASRLKKSLLAGAIFYFITALLLTALTQLFTHMSFPMLMGFLLFATAAALVQEMVVGMAAMHSGWFPATAAALISLVVGMLLGFPPEALAVLVGFCTATGPAFADMGFDLKTGFMIRGYGKDLQRERYGRRQQYIAAMVGFVCAMIVVALSYQFYFAQDKIVPASRLYAATIQAGKSSNIAMMLLMWAVPGALLQLIGGPRHQIGVLFSTGLMIHYPIAGWTVLAALVVRLLMEKVWHISSDRISTLAGGLIAGDALTSAANALYPAVKTKFLSMISH